MITVRSFELQVYDSRLQMISRYPLELTTSPSGLGFKQDVTLIETKTLDYIAERQLTKQDIRLQAHFEEPNSYYKIRDFRAWCGKYITEKLVLYYNDSKVERWIDCIIKDFGVTEINTTLNTVPLIIQALSPFYVITDFMIKSTRIADEKKYNYSYPYAYGGGTIDEAIINNTYFDKIGLNVRMRGKITYPSISLADENGVVFTTVTFPTLVLQEGEILEIDTINSRLLWYRNENDTKPKDMYDSVDRGKDTFLYAQPGYNKVIVNLEAWEENAQVQVFCVQYQL